MSFFLETAVSRSGKKHISANPYAIKSFLDYALRKVDNRSMARGWESKSVEQQQAEMVETRPAVSRPASSEQKERNRRREGLVLSRKRLEEQLKSATHPQHRQMVERALTEVDRQLACFEGPAKGTGT